MREEKGKLYIDSAYEAEVISRSAMYGKKDDIKTEFIRHENLERTSDEIEFVSRVLKFGELVVDKLHTAKALRGLESIAKKNEKFRTVTPHEARFFMQVLAQDPEPVAPQLELTQLPSQIEVPDMSGEIHVTRRTEQAA
jgi:hypothetical protein